VVVALKFRAPPAGLHLLQVRYAAHARRERAGSLRLRSRRVAGRLHVRLLDRL
jgi:hypothetical protein